MGFKLFHDHIGGSSSSWSLMVETPSTPNCRGLNKCHYSLVYVNIMDLEGLLRALVAGLLQLPR